MAEEMMMLLDVTMGSNESKSGDGDGDRPLV